MPTLDEILQSFAPTEAQKKAARAQALMTAGFGLLGTPKGQELRGLGRAGLLGIADYNEQLAQGGEQKMRNLALAQQIMKMQQAEEQQRQAAAAQQELRGAFQGAAGGTPGAAGAASLIDQYRKASVIFMQQGNSEAAKRAADIAASLEEKYSTTPQTLMQDGRLVTALISEKGGTKILEGLGPKPNYEKINTGQQTMLFDPLTQSTGGTFQMQMTPGEVASNKVALGNLGLSRERLNFDKANQAPGQIVESAQGLVRVGKDNSVTPIMAGGAPLQPKPTGAVQQQIASNAVTLAKIDKAMQLVDKTPNAFGLQNFAGDTLMQRVNPSGVEARAMIADIAGQKIHDRSGAAVTVGEAQRLKPYVPNPTDNAATVKKKLALFKREYVAMQAELTQGKTIAEVDGVSGAAPADPLGIR